MDTYMIERPNELSSGTVEETVKADSMQVETGCVKFFNNGRLIRTYGIGGWVNAKLLLTS